MYFLVLCFVQWLFVVLLLLVSQCICGTCIPSVDSLSTSRPVCQPVDLCRLSVDAVYLYTCIPVHGYYHATTVDSVDHPSVSASFFCAVLFLLHLCPWARSCVAVLCRWRCVVLSVLVRLVVPLVPCCAVLCWHACAISSCPLLLCLSGAGWCPLLLTVRKPDASVTGSTHANHRSARSRRLTPEGPARDNPIVEPHTSRTQSEPTIPASAGASGRQK